MKKKRTVILALLLVAAEILLLSCGGDVHESEPIDWSLYTIVIPVGGVDVDKGQENAGPYSRKGKMTEFLEKTEELAGKKLPINYDTGDPVEYEIIVGDCSRQDYREILSGIHYNDYLIERVDNKFFIVANTMEKRTLAVSKFISLMPALNSETPVGTIFLSKGSYKADSMKLNGTDIRDYTIVYGAPQYYYGDYRTVIDNPANTLMETDAVVYFFSFIVEYCGYKLNVISKSVYNRNQEEYPHVIMFGDCGGISSELAPVGDCGYEIISDGNNVALAGSDLSRKGSIQLGKMFATKYFGSSPVSGGVMTVTIPEGKYSGVLVIPD